MKRLALIMAASWFIAAPTARGGELEAEFDSKSNASTPPGVTTNSTSASELDAESPDQACRHRRWRRGYGFGYGRGYGYGGWGW